MAQLETAPFLLARRALPPPELAKLRLRACRVGFTAALAAVLALFAFEVSTAGDRGVPLVSAFGVR